MLWHEELRETERKWREQQAEQDRRWRKEDVELQKKNTRAILLAALISGLLAAGLTVAVMLLQNAFGN
jgi:hypothetical protein